MAIPINLDAPEVAVREKRVGSLLSYHGDSTDLIEKSACCALGCGHRSFSQCGSCSNFAATIMASGVRDAVMINHAPIGCFTDFAGYSIYNRPISSGRVLNGVCAMSTNITERDTVFGAVDKLRETIREAYRRFEPKAIFITASCASGIIGDDIEGVANEMEEELGVPIVPIYCEGFKSRIWTTGFDAAFHGIMRKLVKQPEKKQEDLVNLFNFMGRDSFSGVLKRMGLRVNYLVPNSVVGQLEHMSEAACSTHICETLGAYICQGLEQAFGVPEVKSPPPYGLAWSDQWLREIGRLTHHEQQAEEIIAQERARIAPELENYRRSLGGKRVYVFAGAAYAHNMAAIAHDLGMEVVGVTTFHHDQKNDSEDERLNTLARLQDNIGVIPHFNVCNRQPYQAVNIMRDLDVDILIVRHGGIGTLGAQMGVPVISIDEANSSALYDGVLHLGQCITDAINAKKLIQNIKKHVKLPYTQWWLEQDPYYFETEQEDF